MQDNLIKQLKALIKKISKNINGLPASELSIFKNTPYETIVSDLNKLHKKHLNLQSDFNKTKVNIENLNIALESSKRGIWIWNLDHKRFDINDYMYTIFDVEKKYFSDPSKNFLELINKEDQSRVIRELKLLKKYSDSKTIEFNITFPDGSSRLIATNAKYYAHPKEGAQIIGTCWDVTDTKETEEKITDLFNEFKASAELAPVGIYQLTSEGICIYANNYWYELLESSPQHIIGKSWFDLIFEDDSDRVKEQWEHAVKSNSTFKEEFRIKTNSEDILWITCDATPLIPAKPNDAINYLAVSVNITAQQEHEEHLNYLAHFDSLTNLCNRALFQEKLKDALLRNVRTDKYLVLLFLDLDGFKIINDTLGHDAGDILLQQVAKRLESNVRKTDTIARLGGDEFTILLENVDSPSRVSVSAKKFNDALAKSFNIKGHEVFVTSSIGIAICSKKEPTDHLTLIKQADIAMYLAKEKGKNNFQYFTDDLNTEIHRKMTIGSKLYKVLEQEDIDIHYQPQIDMVTKEVIGVETLLRWFDPEFGNISPAEFIPIAEDNGLIIPISEWLMMTAFEKLAEWKKFDNFLSNIHMSINLSPRHFNDKSLIPFVKRAIEKTNIDPTDLVFEITESLLIGNRQETKDLLKSLKTLGASISLDDFGTGYSSLSYLKQFPIDILKIDQSFIKNLLIDPEDASIVSAIIALSNSLNLQVVAEGVETEGMVKFLTENGCHIGQGYYFSKAQPAKDIEEWANKPLHWKK